ncbi:MAG: ATP-binding protein [Bacteroidales bacterium]|jgi:predicted HTH transcriptional regulator|nr:ATP-binding protein [Bacteroidales bacterium]MDI9576269.1 ATP-binding protein [Bacteroidota bacterium]MDD3755741.1 ATP-binding protein [Bacteroidales bacterium]MDY0401517.1 ATP-binding protein [Bacteroidales bacterium]HOB77300.1 ATP-binding protein [Bacteroidales bacterium]
MKFEEYNLQKRISQGEGQHLDFKFAINDSKKIARSMSAFANADGGILLIGVKDNGKIVGIKSEEEYYMIETAAMLYCKPSIKYDVIKHDIEDKEVLEVIVYYSSDELIYAPDEHNNWCIYIRKNDKNYVASSIYEDVWLARHNNEIVKIDDIDNFRKNITKFSLKKIFTFKEFQKYFKLNYKDSYSLLMKLILLGWVDFFFDDEGEKYQFI